jgi:hypothetical protein
MFDEKHFDRFINFVFNPSLGCMEFATWQSNINTNRKIEKSSYNNMNGGWYNRADFLRADLKRLQGVSGYLSINPVDSEFLARSANEIIRIKKGEGAGENHVVRLRHLSIDIDCQRLSGTSATNEELGLAIEVRNKILDSCRHIRENSIWGCTGNGGYILLRLGREGLPNDDTSRETLKAMLRSLADRFGKQGESRAFVDTNTFFPNVHIGIPGTIKCKGTSTTERPWRLITVDGGVSV